MALRQIDEQLFSASKTWTSVSEVEMLIHNGADITARDESNRTPLYYAVCYGRSHLLPSLSTPDMLKRPIADGTQQTYTHLAIGHFKATVLAKLLEMGCDVNVTVNGYTLLRQSISIYSYACSIVILNDKNIDIDEAGSVKDIVFAVYSGTYTFERKLSDLLLRRMLHLGMSTDGQRQGWTLLNYCIHKQIADWSELLIMQNADVNKRQEAFGLYPLLTACASNSNEAFTQLIDKVDISETWGVVKDYRRTPSGRFGTYVVTGYFHYFAVCGHRNLLSN